MAKKTIFILGLVLVGWVLFTPYSVSAAVVISDLENALMCKCDDKCGKVMINCTCSTSDKTRADFRKKLESGLTTEQVIQIYVDKYGETILSAPTKTGFNLTAWLTPFAALVGGGLGIRKIAQTWLSKGSKGNKDKEEEGQETENSSEPISGEYSKRLEKELDKLEL
jgi:cytochrome c-type biogenesis protein CcmH